MEKKKNTLMPALRCYFCMLSLNLYEKEVKKSKKKHQFISNLLRPRHLLIFTTKQLIPRTFLTTINSHLQGKVPYKLCYKTKDNTSWFDMKQAKLAWQIVEDRNPIRWGHGTTEHGCHEQSTIWYILTFYFTALINPCFSGIFTNYSEVSSLSY